MKAHSIHHRGRAESSEQRGRWKHWTLALGCGWLAATAMACAPAVTNEGGSGGQAPAGSGGATTAGGGGATASGGSPGSGGASPGSGGAASGGANPGAGGASSGGRNGAGGGGVAGNAATAGRSGVGGGSVGGAGTSTMPIVAGGMSKCAGTPAAIGKLCDGFEGAAIAAAGSPWRNAAAMGSTAVVDTTKPYRGTKSVHIVTAGGPGLITETATFTQPGTVATNNDMWGRLFIYFTQTGNPQSHDVFIRLEDPMSTAESAQLHIAGGSRGFLNSEIRSGSDLYHPRMGTGTINYDTDAPKWHCWEWHTTAAATLEFYIDGTIYPGMSMLATERLPFPIFKSMSVGFMEFGTTPATELWIDEVAVDTARIGCDN